LTTDEKDKKDGGGTTPVTIFNANDANWRILRINKKEIRVIRSFAKFAFQVRKSEITITYK
jgi:hypothetical protein